MHDKTATDGKRLIEELRQAVDDHHLEAVVGCFAADFVNETPAHPGRGFRGRDQVRANWQRIFVGIPDIRAEVLRTAVDGDAIWSEWAMGGTRIDGVPQQLRGVILFGVADGHFSWCRFYLEPVDAGDDHVEGAIARLTEAQ
jgi:ketosteroid isomerase-like protein